MIPQGPQEEALRGRLGEGRPEEEDQDGGRPGHRQQEEQEELVSFRPETSSARSHGFCAVILCSVL